MLNPVAKSCCLGVVALPLLAGVSAHGSVGGEVPLNDNSAANSASIEVQGLLNSDDVVMSAPEADSALAHPTFRKSSDGGYVIRAAITSGATMGAALAKGVTLAPPTAKLIAKEKNADIEDVASERSGARGAASLRYQKRAGRGHVLWLEATAGLTMGADLADDVSFIQVASLGKRALPENGVAYIYPRSAERAQSGASMSHWLTLEPYERAQIAAGLATNDNAGVADVRNYATKYRSTSLNRLPAFAAMTVLGQEQHFEGAADLYAFQHCCARPVVVDASAYPTQLHVAHHPLIFGPTNQSTTISLSQPGSF